MPRWPRLCVCVCVCVCCELHFLCDVIFFLFTLLVFFSVKLFSKSFTTVADTLCMCIVSSCVVCACVVCVCLCSARGSCVCMLLVVFSLGLLFFYFSFSFFLN